MIALACFAPPDGRKSWPIRLLADRLVELEVVPHDVRRNGQAGSENNELKPHLKGQWCIPPAPRLRLARRISLASSKFAMDGNFVDKVRIHYQTLLLPLMLLISQPQNTSNAYSHSNLSQHAFARTYYHFNSKLSILV